MAKTAYVNARIDPTLKAKAEQVFHALGMSASTAIAMFYRQVTIRRGMPFDVCIPNQETIAALADAEAGGGEVVHGPTEQLFDEIVGGDKHRRA
jgi:DNA-damage-inducible protein J